jgi:hypothetical protein
MRSNGYESILDTVFRAILIFLVSSIPYRFVFAEGTASAMLSYVTPIDDIVLPTPPPKNPVWAQPRNTFPCIGNVQNGYLIIYKDEQGIARVGLLPYRTRMNSPTADVSTSGDFITMRPSVSIEIGQGGILLKRGEAYRLMGEAGDYQNVLFCSYSFTQEVSVAKIKMLTSKFLPASTNDAKLAKEEKTSIQEPDSRSNKTVTLSITTISGITYYDCTVNQIDPDGVRVLHSKGAAKIPFSDLEESYRKKYNYDPKKADLYIQQKNLVTQQITPNQEDISSAFRFRGRVMQVLENGLLLLPERSPETQEPIFVSCPDFGSADGERWTGWLIPNGRYQYLTKDQIKKTIRSYSVPSVSSIAKLETKARAIQAEEDAENSRKNLIQKRLQSKQVEMADRAARY